MSDLEDEMHAHTKAALGEAGIKLTGSNDIGDLFEESTLPEPSEVENARLAAISTAALGWLDGDRSVQPEFATQALSDVVVLRKKYEALAARAKKAEDELARLGGKRVLGWVFTSDLSALRHTDSIWIYPHGSAEKSMTPVYTHPHLDLTDDEIRAMLPDLPMDKSAVEHSTCDRCHWKQRNDLSLNWRDVDMITHAVATVRAVLEQLKGKNG